MVKGVYSRQEKAKGQGVFTHDSAIVFQQHEKVQTAIHCTKNVDLLVFCPAIAMRDTVEAFVRNSGMTLINSMAPVLMLSN